jgi:hypothetical protein
MTIPKKTIIIYQSLLLFQINAHNLLNTYIYHQLPPTCFSVCYTIFSDAIVLLAQRLYSFNNVVTYIVLHNVICALTFKFALLLRCLEQYVFRTAVPKHLENGS